MASNPHAAAEGGRVGVTRHQRSIDSFQDAVQVGINIAVPKAKHAKAGKCQRLVAFFVFGGMSIQIMLTAVDLYNKSVFHTDEVENVSLAWRLAAEMEPTFTPGAKVIPDFHLLRRERLAETCLLYTSDAA